jgi:lysophospholipase L1-like esterase
VPSTAPTANRQSVWPALLAAGLLVGALPVVARTSAHPALLGRYSYSYALVVAEYLVAVGLAGVLAWDPVRRRGAAQVLRGLSRKGIGVLGLVALATLFVAFLVLGQWMSLAGPWFLGVLVAAGAVVLFDQPRARAFVAGLDAVPWGGLALAGLSLLIALEVALRVFRPVFWSGGPFVQDPIIAFRATSDPEANSLGLRDVEFRREKPPGTYRIVGLGDSMANGFGVPRAQNYHKVLEQLLSAGGGRRVEALNFGVNGMGPQDELRLLERAGLAYAPDLVLLSFYVGNDFSDNPPGTDRFVLNGLPITVRRPEILGGLPPGGSYLSIYLQTIVRPLENELWKWRERRAPGGEPGGALSHERYLGTKAGEMLGWQRLADPAFAGTVAHVQRLLLRMRDLSRSRGAEFLLLVLPSQAQVEDDVRSQVLTHYHQTPDPATVERPQRLLREFAAEHGIRLLDPLADFRARGAGLYLPGDVHFNQAGHRLVAEVLYRYVTANALLVAPDATAGRPESLSIRGGT